MTPCRRPPMQNTDVAAARAARVVAEARRWIGTPYHHQARLRGVGCDCAGLIIGVGLATGTLDFSESRFREFAGYARTPNPRQMRRALEAFLVPVPEKVAGDGDIMWLEWRADLPMHLAICSTLNDVPAQAIAADLNADAGLSPYRPPYERANPFLRYAVALGRPAMIHATGEVGRVVEHGFEGEWPGRLNSFWRYPGVAEVAYNGG